jgi:hypothetical protein
MSNSPSVQYIVFTWVPEDLLDEWNEWHNQVHIPAVLATPMMRGARKYRVTDASLGDWQPQYATVYKLQNMADMQAYLSGPAAELRQDYAERYGAVGRIARMILDEHGRFVAGL